MKLIAGIGIAVAGLALVGCPSEQAGKKPTVVNTSAPLAASELRLGELPYSEGQIVMGGTRLPVTIEKKDLGKGKFQLLSKLKESGTLLEEETYILDDKTFQYVGTGIESFNPPITIANLPFIVPSEWDWTGEYVWDQRNGPAKAKAKIETRRQPLNLPGGQFDDAILSQVKVTIEEAQGNSVDLNLSFWIAPGRGVIRREFAASSTREPAQPAAAP